MHHSAATIEKRAQLATFIERVVRPIACIQALVGIGSLASGRARPDSDIDLIAFLEPFDLYALPAEAIWLAEDGSFHSIFSDGLDAMQVDIARLDLARWRDEGFVWPEGRKAELAHGWVAFDRAGKVAQLMAERTHYPDSLRMSRLDEAITWLDQHLSEDGPAIRWQSLGPALAHDRLNAAYGYLVQALFALNRQWQPWRNRELDALLGLTWLPQHLDERILMALTAAGHNRQAYDARVTALISLMSDVLARAQEEGIYSADPIGEAFIRSHEEPGRTWNMAAWKREHGLRYKHFRTPYPNLGKCGDTRV